MKTYGSILLCLLCVTSSAMWGLTQYRLNHERAVFEEYYNTRPLVELKQDPTTGDVLIRVDGRFYYGFTGVCPAIKKT